jgi:anti-repressor protein
MELIKVEINEKGEQLVSGRELHKFLENTERFSSWFNRQLAYGFEEDVDYVGCKTFNTLANTELQDYIIKISMAKEISMIQRNEKGKLARKYFIDCERRLLEVDKKKMLLADLFDDDKMVVVNAHKKLVEIEKQPLLDKIEIDKPRVEFAETIERSSDSILVRDVSKILANEGIKFGEKKLYAWLRENSLIEKCKNIPTQKGIDLGLFVVIESVYNTAYGKKISFTPKVTGKGQVYIVQRIKKEFQA